jgi:S-adenosylmethionine hydrolase
VFAPVAAHLSTGVPIERVGTVIDDPVRFGMPVARRTDRGVEGEVLYIDDFGNAICSILPSDIADLGEVAVELCGATIEGMVETFGDSEYGADILIALWDSSGYLLVSENNGTGGKVIRPRPGDRVLVRPVG